MCRTVRMWLGVCASIALLGGCAASGSRTPPAGAEAMQAYTHRDAGFSLAYPAGWIIENESYQSVTLVPAPAQGWQPAAPAEIPQDPRVTLEMGDYIGEKLGPAQFPADVDPVTLRAWLEQKVHAGAGRDLSALTIHDIQAFALTEINESDCERVVYWRPAGPAGLVRLSTGCESAYLKEFDRIVGSLR